MRFTSHWLDITENIQTKTQPVYIMERSLPFGGERKRDFQSSSTLSRVGAFWVPTSPVMPEVDIAWSLTKTGEFVRVPITGYETAAANPACLSAHGVQLGLLAMESLSKKTSREVIEVHMVLGTQIYQMPGQNKYIHGLGLAFRVKEDHE